jgi:hypothetical protein
VDNPWLQGAVFVLAALVIGILITLGSSLLRLRQPDGPSFDRKPKSPLPSWGNVARETFWALIAIGVAMSFVRQVFEVDWFDGGVWWWIRTAISGMSLAAGLVWAWAVWRRRTTASH